MSFGRFPGFDNDPFFCRPMGMQFPSFPAFPMLGAAGHHGHMLTHRSQPHTRPEQQLSLFDPFSMFRDMDKMMAGGFRGSQVGDNGHYFSSSSVMHYSSSGDGAPKVYSASSSVTQGPGGVKETRKSECNSESGMKKMAIGHHIGDRAHIIENTHDVKKNERVQNQDFINLVEDDSSSFDREWQGLTKRSMRYQPRVHHHNPAINLPSIRSSAITSRDEERQRDHRSRSPERKRKGKSKATVDSSHQDSSNAAAAARRREYVTDDGFTRKVHF